MRSTTYRLGQLSAPRTQPQGLELILPDWFYAGVLDNALILTIDRAYFRLTGGLERWLYRLVRKDGGQQADGSRQRACAC